MRLKFIVTSNVSCSTDFFLYRYFVEATITDIDMLLQV